LFICDIADAASVRAWLDRNNMRMGETVTLNVEVSGDNGVVKPDFSSLALDFGLLATQSSTSVNIVNGQSSAKLLWAIGLEPKHAGTLTIPALDVAGQRTQALSLNVLPAVAGAGGKAGDDVYIDAAIEPRAAYVQQQVSLTVKLYFAVNLTDGSLDEPHADGLVVRKLGQDVNYATDIGGRRYHVLERHYALLPEKSGAWSLSPIAFRGHAVDPSDVNSFFSRGRGVGARADAITLDVRPRPPASGNDAWLPARSVTLDADGIDATVSAKVGEPLTLALRLKAQGLGFEQLPELALPKIDGTDVYPDKTTTQNRDDGEWLYGERERKFAIVPNRAGPLNLPAISIDWWDTVHDRAQTVEVPALTLNVEAAASRGPGAPVAGDAADARKEPNATNSATPANVAEPIAAADALRDGPGDGAQLRIWRLLAACAAALWLLTLVAWMLSRRVQYPRTTTVRPPAVPGSVATGAASSAMRTACTREDWPAAARALLAWSRAEHPGLRNLGELARLLDDPEQVAAIDELERVCYGRGVAAGFNMRLAGAFRKRLNYRRPAAAAGTITALPALYPFRL